MRSTIRRAGVTMLDADADPGNEDAILEPGVGETPLWNSISLSALFPHDADPLLLLAALESFDPGLDWSGVSFRHVEDQDWERAWMDQYVPLRFGQRTWIVPWNHELPAGADAASAAVVRLDPGLAFGSGTHPTTALCLRWLDGLASKGLLDGARVLDFGCGSGILALAALKLGPRMPPASTTTAGTAGHRRHRRAQRGCARLSCTRPTRRPTELAIVVANILARPLDALADTLPRAWRRGPARAVGHPRGQQGPLLQRYGRGSRA